MHHEEEGGSEARTERQVAIFVGSFSQNDQFVVAAQKHPTQPSTYLASRGLPALQYCVIHSMRFFFVSMACTDGRTVKQCLARRTPTRAEHVERGESNAMDNCRCASGAKSETSTAIDLQS